MDRYAWRIGLTYSRFTIAWILCWKGPKGSLLESKISTHIKQRRRNWPPLLGMSWQSKWKRHQRQKAALPLRHRRLGGASPLAMEVAILLSVSVLHPGDAHPAQVSLATSHHSSSSHEC